MVKKILGWFVGVVLKGVYKKLDRNKDGKVTSEEFLKAMEDLGKGVKDIVAKLKKESK